MKQVIDHASDEQLLVLVHQDEQSSEVKQIAEHVEQCKTCRERLQDLTGGDAFDLSARDCLAGADSESLLFDGESLVASTIDPADYLTPPGHPELLGRIGKYDVERVLGSGGMGVVFKAFDQDLNRPVAIKVLARHLAHNGSAKQRFTREAKAVAAVVNPHVVSIYNVDTSEAAPFLVMQYVGGESLQTRVDREGPLDAIELLRIATHAATGIEAAHEQGVVHRDIKPGNILLEQGAAHALVTDFGLAQTLDDASLTQSGIIAGTPHYMSPEQAQGHQTDARSDLYSLGAVMYFMATGRPPFRAEKPMGVLHRICKDTQTPVWQINSNIPLQVNDIIDRLLRKKPTQRFDSATDLRIALAKCLASMQDYRPNKLESIRRRFRQYRFASIAAIVILFVSLFGLATWGAFQLGDSKQNNFAGQQENDLDLESKNKNSSDPPSAISEPASFDGSEETDQWNEMIQQLGQDLDEFQQELEEDTRK